MQANSKVAFYKIEVVQKDKWWKPNSAADVLPSIEVTALVKRLFSNILKTSAFLHKFENLFQPSNAVGSFLAKKSF